MTDLSEAMEKALKRTKEVLKQEKAKQIQENRKKLEEKNFKADFSTKDISIGI